jgi:DNA-binding NarL/FixJ family response regulator
LDQALALRSNDRSRAYLRLFDAYVARHEGRGDDAVAHARRAVVAATRIGFRRLAIAALEISGDRAAALSLAQECGDLRALARLRQPAESNPATKALGSLTPREREIAEMVAAGEPNRRIAERCSLSLRTVEHHVAAILRKTATRSRSELAARWSRISEQADCAVANRRRGTFD